jgi:hypothetical protein
MERSSGPGNGQKLTFTIAFMPVGSTVDGVPVYTVSDDTLIVVTPSADGMSGEVTNLNIVTDPVDHPPPTVTVTADADLGEGVQNLSQTSEPIDILDHPAIPATGIGFTFTPVAA